jgi:NitT/TauT family transport system ATP-binding protein
MMPEVASPRPAICLQNVGVTFEQRGSSTEAVKDLSMEVKDGEFLCVLGPSGCGKSTILSAIAGVRPISSGLLTINGTVISRPGADRGMVFQQHALFPWRTVQENIEFGLRMRGVSREQRVNIVRNIIEHIGLIGFERHFPGQLSGGMQQRVELARVLVNKPSVLLMDEPFGALDAQTRVQMQELLLSIWDESRMTTVFVTHDVDEAILLADRIFVMSNRPASIKAEVIVPLQRPRCADTTVSPEFVNLKRACMRLLRASTHQAA